ncbi:MAG TPA: biotin/lipoyl-containing protein [Candidatus Limnocylindrales bacterium]|nr:biotin/lipoyl-containing protein [Candidatus Limnocylindrales bacterium]
MTEYILPDPARDGEASEVAGAGAEVEIELEAPESAGELSEPVAEADLLALIDRLAGLLDRSDLTELEVEAGGTGLVLRKPIAIAASAAAAGTATAAPEALAPAATAQAPPPVARPAITAPLTGIFYASPAPGSAPYVQVGGEVAVGQVIGLIEAMKLFNEIKSDLAGRVVKVVAESGALVKARQPLIEVEPL